jgi:protein O-mannosyl-transferase
MLDLDRQDKLRALVILVLTLLAYAYATQCGYIWDDDMYVYQNPTLLNLQGLYDIWFTPGATPQYYPLVFTGFWIEYALFGLNPLSYHLINILLHAANAILIWRLLHRLNVPSAWLAGLVFAVHPVNVESVAWVTERKNVLSMCLYLLSAHALLSWSPPEQDKPFKDRPPKFYALAVLAFLGALLSKTTACTLPAAWLVVIWWKRGTLTFRDFLYALPMFILGGAFGLWTAYLEKTHVGAEGGEWAFSILERIQIAGNVICFYASKLLFPSTLTFIYPRWQISSSRPVMFIAPVVVLGIIAALWIYREKLGRGALAGWLFFIGTLFPALGFFNVYPFRYSFVADHFQYLAAFGFIALIVAGITRLFDTIPGDTTRFKQILAGIFVAGLAMSTLAQTTAYTSAQFLWEDTLVKNPTAWLASNNLGMIMRDQRNYPRAQELFEQTVALNPNMLEGRMNLAEILIEQGKLAESLPHIKEAQAIEPRHPEPVMAEGRVLKQMGRIDEARIRLLDATAIYENVVLNHPDSPLGLFGLGRAYNATDRGSDAVKVLTKLVQLTPGDGHAWSQLGLAYLKSGDVPRAVANYLNALQIMPENAEVIDRLGRILATTTDEKLRDPDRALMLANEAVRLTFAKSPPCLDTLALAYAAKGDFKNAIQTAAEARKLAEAAGFSTLVPIIVQHEAAFKENKPVLMTPKELAEQ